MSNETRKAEAEGTKTAVVKFRGREFTIPTDYNDWPLELHEALEDGREIAVIRAAFGQTQWAVVRAMGLTTPGINELATAVSEALGFKSTGESPASSA